jgi:hypothetical protein
MSLLDQKSGSKTDNAARGEAYTKGSSYMIWGSLIAAVLVIIVVAAYVLIEEKPPVASGEIVQVWAHPQHVESSGIDANGAPMARESVDQVLLIAYVKLHNRSENPLLLQDVLANAKLGDGTLSVSAGSTAQYEEALIAYPELAALRANALSPHRIIAPGENLDGNIFWIIRMTKNEWEARKGLDFTLTFQYQPKLVLTPPAAVTEL